MSDAARPSRHNTRKLLTVGAACTVVWLAMASIFRAEEGLGADITWLVSTVFLLVGVVSLVLAGVAALRNRG